MLCIYVCIYMHVNIFTFDLCLLPFSQCPVCPFPWTASYLEPSREFLPICRHIRTPPASGRFRLCTARFVCKNATGSHWGAGSDWIGYGQTFSAQNVPKLLPKSINNPQKSLNKNPQDSKNNSLKDHKQSNSPWSCSVEQQRIARRGLPRQTSLWWDQTVIAQQRWLPEGTVKLSRSQYAIFWLVVWNILYFPIYWEESSQLTNIFQRGSNHQPVLI